MITTVLELQLSQFDEAFDRFPDLQVHLVSVRSMQELSALFWFEGVDRSALDDCLQVAPDIEQCRHLESAASSHLYRLGFSPDTRSNELYRTLVDLDGGIIDATADDGGWTVELFFPSRTAISTFFGRAADLGTSPTLLSVTADTVGIQATSYGLTSVQRETLVTAAEMGYFSVPKEASLVELADELGISDQAASERVRRGILALIDATIRDRETPILQV